MEPPADRNPYEAPTTDSEPIDRVPPRKVPVRGVMVGSAVVGAFLGVLGQIVLRRLLPSAPWPGGFATGPSDTLGFVLAGAFVGMLLGAGLAAILVVSYTRRVARMLSHQRSEMLGEAQRRKQNEQGDNDDSGTTKKQR